MNSPYRQWRSNGATAVWWQRDGSQTCCSGIQTVQGATSLVNKTQGKSLTKEQMMVLLSPTSGAVSLSGLQAWSWPCRLPSNKGSEGTTALGSLKARSQPSSAVRLTRAVADCGPKKHTRGLSPHTHTKERTSEMHNCITRTHLNKATRMLSEGLTMTRQAS